MCVRVVASSRDTLTATVQLLWNGLKAPPQPEHSDGALALGFSLLVVLEKHGSLLGIVPGSHAAGTEPSKPRRREMLFLPRGTCIAFDKDLAHWGAGRCHQTNMSHEIKRIHVKTQGSPPRLLIVFVD
jgi:hypothetical protein